MGKGVKGTTGSRGTKSEFDKFYTKSEIALACLSRLDLTNYDTVIEPSAGSGAFSSLIPAVKAYDLKPEAEGIQQADWLLLDKRSFTGDNILVVGNPPFGSGGHLAMKFLKESCSFADTVAFILPKSFKKTSVKNRVPANFTVTDEWVLPSNSFTLNGEDYDVPCVFQVWNKTDTPRTRTRGRTTTPLFIFTTPAQANLRIQRVGGNAGKASTNLAAATTSNYFIRTADNIEPTHLAEIVNAAEFPTITDTVGPKSLSKDELITVIEEALGLGKES